MIKILNSILEIKFTIPKSTGLLEGSDYQVVIQGRKRFWNRRIVWSTLFMWFFSIRLLDKDIHFQSNKNTFYFIIYFCFAYAISLDHYILITGNWDSGWDIVKFIGNSKIYVYFQSQKSKNVKAFITVSSYRKEAIAIVKLQVDNGSVKIKIDNTQVKNIREELDNIGIENALISYITGKIF